MINKRIIDEAHRKLKSLNSNPKDEINIEYVKEVLSEFEVLTQTLATDIIKVYRTETAEHLRAIKVLGGV